jgi:thioester reductase-like protein
MQDKKVIFLTGVTGLVGSYLTKILLEEGNKVYVLARDKGNKSAFQRVKDVLNFWDKRVFKKYRNNLIVLKGDITKKDLGLKKKNKAILKNKIEEIFHSAAFTNVNLSLNKIRKVIVEGTRNILELALQCKNLRKVNHISTAFVCGDYKGVFKETDLDVGQNFNSTYEQSNFEAEKLVHKYRKKRLWIDIYRPSIIIGDSQRGKILQFRNIYHLASFCYAQIFDKLPLANVYINVVPVDFCCKALYILSQSSEDKNKTYHIFPKSSIFAKSLLLYFSKAMEFRIPKLVSLSNFDFSALTPVQQKMLKYIVSVNLNVHLSSHLTNNILKKLNFSFPEIDEELFRPICAYFINKRVEFFQDKGKMIKEIIEGIIEAGIWGPSVPSFLPQSQPSKFIVVEDKDMREKIVAILEKKKNKARAGINIMLASARNIIKQAQVVILIYNAKKLEKSLSERFKEIYCRFSSLIKKAEFSAISAAIQNMILVAESLGN